MRKLVMMLAAMLVASVSVLGTAAAGPEKESGPVKECADSNCD